MTTALKIRAAQGGCNSTESLNLQPSNQLNQHLIELHNHFPPQSWKKNLTTFPNWLKYILNSVFLKYSNKSKYDDQNTECTNTAKYKDLADVKDLAINHETEWIARFS